MTAFDPGGSVPQRDRKFDPMQGARNRSQSQLRCCSFNLKIKYVNAALRYAAPEGWPDNAGFPTLRASRGANIIVVKAIDSKSSNPESIVRRRCCIRSRLHVVDPSMRETFRHGSAAVATVRRRT
jgi:hypothetical protein